MSVSNKAATLLTVAQVLMAEAKAGLNPFADCDRANEVVDRLLARYDSQVAAALQVTIPGSKANFAAAYAVLTSIVDGAVFTVSSSVDTTDTSLATAKGSAPAAGDTFQRSGTAPVYVGNATGRAAIVSAMAYQFA
jgi:hypothetical protein